MAVPALPILQTPAAPETAAARKPSADARAPDDSSFADVLESEIAGAEAGADVTLSAHTQPAPSPTPAAPHVLAALQSAPPQPGQTGATPDAQAEEMAATSAAPGVTAPSVDSLSISPQGQTSAPAAQPVPALALSGEGASTATPDAAASGPSPAAVASPAPAAPASPQIDSTGVQAEGRGAVPTDPAAVPTAPTAWPAPAMAAVAPTAVEMAQQAPPAPVVISPVQAEKPVAAQPQSDASAAAAQGEHASDADAQPAIQAQADKPSAGSAQPSPAKAQGAQPQQVAPDAPRDVRIDASAPSSSTSTSASEALATGRLPTADTGRPAQTHPALQSAPAAVLQVHARFIERFDGRAQRFEVRLDPAELGRVDVRIEVGADRRVHAILAAHDSAALSDLMRGQRALERALSDAGIDLADGGIQFELSDDSGRGPADGQRGEAWTSHDHANAWRDFSTEEVVVEAAHADAAAATLAYRRGSARLDLVA